MMDYPHIQRGPEVQMQRGKSLYQRRKVDNVCGVLATAPGSFLHSSLKNDCIPPSISTRNLAIDRCIDIIHSILQKVMLLVYSFKIRYASACVCIYQWSIMGVLVL